MLTGRLESRLKNGLRIAQLFRISVLFGADPRKRPRPETALTHVTATNWFQRREEIGSNSLRQLFGSKFFQFFKKYKLP
jgi:hypothetical protein